jgi:hypothetical protein
MPLQINAADTSANSLDRGTMLLKHFPPGRHGRRELTTFNLDGRSTDHDDKGFKAFGFL